MAADQSLLHTDHTCSSLLIIVLIFQYLFQTSLAIPLCPSSSCGNIPNISFPFRLNHDPDHCGDFRFELSCQNNLTSININSHEYYLKEINYQSHTIRLVDASIKNDDTCSFPNVSAYAYKDFTYGSYRFLYPSDSNWPINLMSCPHPLKNSSPFTEITHCAAAANSSNPRFTYIKVGHMNSSEVTEMCGLELIVMTSWKKFKDLKNVSLSEIHQSLLHGFQLDFVWESEKTEGAKFVNFFFVRFKGLLLIPVILVGSLPIMIIIGFIGLRGILSYIVNELLNLLLNLLLLSTSVTSNIFRWHDKHYWPTSSSTWTTSSPLLYLNDVLRAIGLPVGIILRFIIFPFIVWLLIYKFRRRHLSVFHTIECFLQSDNNLTPIRYSYSNIKSMTKGFQAKLGEGGYGSVYKGRLRSGRDVAIKLLGKSGANGKDFINEIATIGRIHHVNVVKLVGYCAQGSKRALVFDFMSNGSLEKYLFNPEKMNSLNWDTKFEIAVGVARGIEYLHRGCDIQILHFDIKPHNILLDDKFIPKISDFGLAKFCSANKNTVTLTAARGTIGYVAPELINRSIGVVSYKADVYSFGMVLMEIVNMKRDLRGNNGDSSQYFPNWIYDQLNQDKGYKIGNVDEIENINDDTDGAWKLARKITIVALWCIQMNPDDRPSMNKVLEMLEGEVENLQIPNYPSQSPDIIVNGAETWETGSTESASTPYYNGASRIEIAIEE